MLPSDTKDVLKKWLKSAGRKLTPHQFNLLTAVFSSNPLPLYLKLCFDTARRWGSYEPPAVTVLQSTVTDTIRMLFERTERIHGKILVSYALGYVTAGLNFFFCSQVSLKKKIVKYDNVSVWYHRLLVLHIHVPELND